MIQTAVIATRNPNVIPEFLDRAFLPKPHAARGALRNNHRSVPVEEQLKNAKAMILMAAKQPIVREAIRAYAVEHFSENERIGAVPIVRKQPLPPSISTGKAVESALASVQGKFSYVDVLTRLDQGGVPLKVRNRRTAVGAVLQRLCRRRMIREVQKGIAGKPSYYERLPKQDDAAD